MAPVVNTSEASPSSSEGGTDPSPTSQPTPQPTDSTEQDHHELQALRSGDANTGIIPVARPVDLEQGHQRQVQPSGVPGNADANLKCPDTNATEIKKNATDRAADKKKEEPKAPPLSRKERLRTLHITTQRLTVAENSCKDIENRVSLLLRSVEALKSIPQENGRGFGNNMQNRILRTTLDREQQILDSIRLSCQHSQQWTRCYKERTNIQIQLVLVYEPPSGLITHTDK